MPQRYQVCVVCTTGEPWLVTNCQFPGGCVACNPNLILDGCDITAGTSPDANGNGVPDECDGCCAGCGAPYARVLQLTGKVMEGAYSRTANVNQYSEFSALRGQGVNVYRTTGWKPTCSCKAGHEWLRGYCQVCETKQEAEGLCRVPAVVCDPFSGAATTGLVANQLGRDYLGIELSAAYAAMGQQRIMADAPLFNHD
jgi:hypothetical protein